MRLAPYLRWLILAILSCCVLVSAPRAADTPRRPILPLLEELLSLLETGGSCEQIRRLSTSIAGSTSNGPVEILELANLGGGTNFERNLHHWADKQLFAKLLPAPYKFQLTKKGFSEPQDHYCILPHELFSSIFSSGAIELFHHLFTGGTENLLQWWEAAASVDDNWYRQHPVVQSQPDAAKRIPFGLHGDDAGMRGAESILVVTWGSVAFRGATMDMRLLFGMIKLREVEKDVTLDQFYEVLRWSLEALSKGEFPETNHLGIPFTNDYERKRFLNRHHKLAGGYVGAWAELRGDWKWLKETLHLQHNYQTNYVCHLCNAHKHITRLLYTDLDPNAAYNRTIVDDVAWWYHYASALLVCPLLFIPGFNIFRVLIDILHTLDLGLYQHVVASVVWQLTSDNNYLEGDSRQARFDNLFKKYKDWCVRFLSCATRCATRVFFTIAQPASSIMWDHPRLRAVLRLGV